MGNHDCASNLSDLLLAARQSKNKHSAHLVTSIN